MGLVPPAAMVPPAAAAALLAAGAGDALATAAEREGWLLWMLRIPWKLLNLLRCARRVVQILIVVVPPLLQLPHLDLGSERDGRLFIATLCDACERLGVRTPPRPEPSTPC